MKKECNECGNALNYCKHCSTYHCCIEAAENENNNGWIDINHPLDDDETVALLFVEKNGGYTSYGYGHYSSYTDDIEITYNPYKNTVIDYELTHYKRIGKPQ